MSNIPKVIEYLLQYSIETGTNLRSTSDLSPLEEWLLNKLHSTEQLYKPVIMQGSDSETQTYVDRGDRYEVKPYDPEFIKLPSVGQRSVGTNAAGGHEKCTCPDDQCLLGDHPICRWKEYYARKSSEGHL